METLNGNTSTSHAVPLRATGGAPAHRVLTTAVVLLINFFIIAIVYYIFANIHHEHLKTSDIQLSGKYRACFFPHLIHCIRIQSANWEIKEKEHIKLSALFCLIWN